MERCYLARVSFLNCQSLKEVSYDFIDGINVITAPNSTGKSVFYKALKVAVGATFFSNTELQHLISYGERQACACFEFTDGSSGGFIATMLDGVKRVQLQYVYKEATDTAFASYTAPSPEFIRKMSIVLDEKTTFIMNVLDPDQELLFVNSNEATNSSIVKLVSDNPTLEALDPLIDLHINDVKAVLGNISIASTNVASMLDNLEVADIPTLQSQVLYGGSLIEPCKALITVAKMLDGINPVTVVDYRFTDTLLEQFFVLEKSLSLIDMLDIAKPVDPDITHFVDSLVSFDTALDLVKCLKSKAPNSEENIISTSLLIDKVNTLNQALELTSGVKIVNQTDTADLDAFLKLYKIICEGSTYLSQVCTVSRLNLNDVETLASLHNRLQQVDSLLTDLDHNLNKESEVLNALSLLITDIASISEVVVCPVKGEVYFSDEGCIPKSSMEGGE